VVVKGVIELRADGKGKQVVVQSVSDGKKLLGIR
jgi:hypothetical protein